MKMDSRDTHRSASGVSVLPASAARPRPWLPMAIFIALAALGVGLRWFELGRQSLWFDEGYSAWVATLSPAHIVAVIANDVSPPLYYLLLHGWTRCFGESETALRAFSALAGTVALCIFMDLALRLTSSWPARIMAIALFAFSPLAVQFSQEARSYSLSAMFALGALWGMFVFLDQNKPRPFMIALVCAGASVWLHNMMWFYLAALNAAWLLSPSRLSPRARLLSLVLLDVIVVAAYLPWVPSLLGQMRWLKGNFWATVPSLNSLKEVLGLIAGSNLYYISSLCHALRVPGIIGPATQAAMWISAGLLLLAPFGHGHDPRRHEALRTGASSTVGNGAIIPSFSSPLEEVGRGSQSARDMEVAPVELIRTVDDVTALWRLTALVAFAILPVLAVFIHAQSGQSYFIVKIFATSALVFPLAIAMAADRFPIRRVGRFLGLVLLTASLVSTWGYFRWDVKEDWRGASRYVNTVDRKGTLVVFLANEGEYLYDYYCRRDGVAPLARTGLPQSFFDLTPPRTIQRVKSVADMDRLARRIDADQISRVVLVLSHTSWSDPANLATTYLDQHFTLGNTKPFALVEVREYSK